ncbi:MAG: hypothetical protein JOZ05_22755 [Acetobacteraceae bacterium]|nr:hypothetical protein [Acetobacteraceae bacterium]
MYDQSDPRTQLTSAGPARPQATEFAAAEYAKFYAAEPQESGPFGRTWYARGQNFLVAYTEAAQGAVLSRSGQVDEYVLLLPDRETAAEVSTRAGAEKVPSYGLAFIPPGDSSISLPTGGRVVRLFTTKSQDLAARCSNAAAYERPHPNIPPLQSWPEPRGGWRVRAYSLDVPQAGGRFGRIFRCTTFMVNYLDPRQGARDVTKLSPHHHDDFEQCSLALEGAFIHDIRWPWTSNMNAWRDDDHEYCAAPSVAVIPPPAIHTSRAVGEGVNQLVDIFCPPRLDFSAKPGWVLNADDYPMPAVP